LRLETLNKNTYGRGASALLPFFECSNFAAFNNVITLTVTRRNNMKKKFDIYETVRVLKGVTLKEVIYTCYHYGCNGEQQTMKLKKFYVITIIAAASIDLRVTS
jgi:hypothetical protein